MLQLLGYLDFFGHTAALVKRHYPERIPSPFAMVFWANPQAKFFGDGSNPMMLHLEGMGYIGVPGVPFIATILMFTGVPGLWWLCLGRFHRSQRWLRNSKLDPDSRKGLQYFAGLGKLSRTILLDFFRLRPKTAIIVMNAYEEVITMTTLYNLFQFGFLLKQQFWKGTWSENSGSVRTTVLVKAHLGTYKWQLQPGSHKVK